MKKIFNYGILMLIIAVPAFSQTNWVADKAHSTVGFTVSHMVISEVSGKFDDFEVRMTSSPSDFSNAVINVKIKTKSIDTGIKPRDNHLRSADFFNADVDSLITFASTSIEKQNEKKYLIRGNLSMHGVTKPVTLDAVYKGKIGTDQNERIVFKATSTINRTEWGLKWNRAMETGGLLVGEEVELSISMEFVVAKKDS
ncbi:MAG: YceI family protein [Bacteroidetes bacterium]|nr:YceI family protein [Bacteroidota bacterium]